MKVRMTLDVDAYTRYVIARYFGTVSPTPADRRRGRATRAQVKRFVQGAIATAAREYAANMHGKPKATATRLRAGAPEPKGLEPPAEEQPSLLNY